MLVHLSPHNPAFEAEQGRTSSTGVVQFTPIHPGTYHLEFFRHNEVACEQIVVVQVPAWTDMQHPVTCWQKRVAMLLHLGLLEFEQDTVRMHVGVDLPRYHGQLVSVVDGV